jgi:signal peptidase I
MNWKFWKKNASKEDKPKSKAREWWDAIVFAVIAATLIRWLIMEAYTIPTPSMENSLLVGDFLFVSKFHYGARTTSTPLQVPLTHQKIWFTNIPSYSTAIKLPSYRLPGISHVKREDVVVFNVPPVSENNGVEYPVDLKTNYIKRCVGIPGDKLSIIDNQVYINDSPLGNPPEMEYSYIVKTNTTINDRVLEAYDVKEVSVLDRAENSRLYFMVMPKSKAEELSKLPFVLDVTLNSKNKGEADSGIFPNGARFPWNRDFYGPLLIPGKGTTIAINDSTLALYGSTIVDYDLNKDAKITDGKLFIDGKEVTEYTFNQNYYFMMGDSRHRSQDSRYFGLVPEDHIVGKALFIWLSLDANKSFLSKIRWNRFFKYIR